MFQVPSFPLKARFAREARRARLAKGDKFQNTGQSLMMLLVVIVIAGVTLGLGSQFIALRVKTKEAAKQRIISSRLAQESLEVVRAIAQEDWDNNIANKTCYEDDPAVEYYPYLTETNIWNLTTDPSYKTPEGAGDYERWIVFHKVSRDPTTENVEVTYNPDNDDLSTRKVTAYAKNEVSGREVSVDYYLTNWQNQ